MGETSRRALLGTAAAAVAVSAIPAAAAPLLPAEHPDAALAAAWARYKAASVALNAAGLDGLSDEEMEPHYAPADAAAAVIDATPARTPAGAAIKLRLAFVRVGQSNDHWDAAFGGEPTARLLADHGDALMWAAIRDLEAMVG